VKSSALFLLVALFANDFVCASDQSEHSDGMLLEDPYAGDCIGKNNSNEDFGFHIRLVATENTKSAIVTPLDGRRNPYQKPMEFSDVTFRLLAPPSGKVYPVLWVAGNRAVEGIEYGLSMMQSLENEARYIHTSVSINEDRQDYTCGPMDYEPSLRGVSK
jgi:hypothetical protein